MYYHKPIFYADTVYICTTRPFLFIYTSHIFESVSLHLAVASHGNVGSILVLWFLEEFECGS